MSFDKVSFLRLPHPLPSSHFLTKQGLPKRISAFNIQEKTQLLFFGIFYRNTGDTRNQPVKI